MIDHLKNLGATAIFHAGDITGESADPCGCIEMAFAPGHYAVVGNHDILAVGDERVHEYTDVVKTHARKTRENLDAESKRMILDAPAKIDTAFFSVVHESVAPPYYAKRSKRRRRSHGWDVGSSSDENTAAVCYSRIDRPHFIGSDHAAYAIVAQPMLKILKPAPDDELDLPLRAVVSVPSVAFSRDDRYDCAGIFGRIERGVVKIRFISIHPKARTGIYAVP